MESSDAQRRLQRSGELLPGLTPARLAALGSLIVVAVVALVIVLGSTGGGGGSGTHARSQAPIRSSASKSGALPQTVSTAVPILAYHIINQAPPQSSLPSSLYVPVDEFTAQMQALKAAGWHAVTLDQLEAYWAHGTSLGSGKPIVITFDDGYASQYTNALPVLKQLGWVGVEDLRANGLAASDGGLSDTQIRGLISGGWEIDTDGTSQPDLTVIGSGGLSSEVTAARQTLSARYGVPVNWFAYPSGRYNPTVTAAVQSAGFVGATTLVSGWASPKANRFLLPRLQVVPGTSASQLVSQIGSAQQTTAVPTAGSGT